MCTVTAKQAQVTVHASTNHYQPAMVAIDVVNSDSYGEVRPFPVAGMVMGVDGDRVPRTGRVDDVVGGRVLTPLSPPAAHTLGEIDSDRGGTGRVGR